MTSSTVFDYIVIGAGILGSSTAYHLSCSSSSNKILLLEQFDTLHQKGSSHGNSRIIRFTYEDAMYSRMGIQALTKWKQLQDMYPHNKTLYTNTGTLDFGRRDNEDLQKVIQVVQVNKVDHLILNAEQLREKFPALANSFAITDDYVGVFQKDGGSLNAIECVRMFQHLAQKNGVQLRDKEPVVQITRVNQTSTACSLLHVRTNRDIYVTKKVIVCTGSWTPQFVNNQIEVHNGDKQQSIVHNAQAQQMSYAFFDVKKNIKKFERESFPIWIHWGKHFQGETLEQKHYLDAVEDKTELAYYGFPTLECENYGYIKAGVHFAVNEDYLADANVRTFAMPDVKKKLIKNFMRRMFSLEYDDPCEPQQLHTCLYTVTDDHDFIIDYHPADHNIVIASGCSGHLFKFAPVLGEFIADMSTNDRREHVSEERIRFKLKHKRSITSKL